MIETGNIYMKTGFVKEIDYYDEILNFYEDSGYNNGENKKKYSAKEIERWSNLSYIYLMKDVRKNKKLADDTEIMDVAKNSIILILNLFDQKCQIKSNADLEGLSRKEKDNIKMALIQALD